MERSWVEIDLDAFRHNLKALKSFLKPEQGFIQIVKADAYGHGAWEIAQAALKEGATALGVANLEEGKLLRIEGCKAPILILSPSLIDEIPGILEYKLIPTVNDLLFAQALISICAKQKVKCLISLKFDSGMHRSGILEKDFAELWYFCKNAAELEVKSFFSHFASSESDLKFSEAQEKRFKQVIDKYKVEADWIHIANSSALINGLGSSGNLCRLGILSYGVYTHPSQKEKIELKPVMTFKSTVIQIKEIPKGATVGYNQTWKAQRKTRYAVIPVGYADGYDFLLSNKGKVLIEGIICPVIGKVSMDMICVDLTDAPEIQCGAEVILLGNGHNDIRVENLVSLYNGSSYELLCQVGRRAKRYYYEKGRLVTAAPLSRRDFVSSDYPNSKLNQIIQSAIAQRINSEEMSELIFREILRVFFYNQDRDIRYRKNFRHHILFTESLDKDYWKAETTLSFSKTLQRDFFLVACANSDKALKDYFKRNDVEYRWLMDGNFQLNPTAFQLSSVKVNGLELTTRINFKAEAMEIRCSHPELKKLIGQEVRFEINTLTLYPKASHQLSVFITELTHGVQISFSYPETLKQIECVPFFAGQNKYPKITTSKNTISVTTKPEEWVFPQSGVVFAY
ncbi:MAG: Alanine racemase [Candidatus Cloacimonetes bacterium ADurb.Bin211]|nr:MAG: Alanine racemase [Candidatus Cloacimonetes bacterium ADurb.Bin211]